MMWHYRPRRYVAGILAVILGLTLRVVLYPNWTVIQNSSGVEIQNVTLQMADGNGKVFLDKHVERLAPDEMITFRHGKTDSQAELQYTFAGKQRTYTEGYIDLWNSEGWRFDIQPDGSVIGDYGHGH